MPGPAAIPIIMAGISAARLVGPKLAESLISRGLAKKANNSSAKVIGTANGAFESETMSIAFNVNDSLSFSWSELTETYDEQDMGTVADVDMDSTSIQFAYTMGSMSIKGYQTDTDNPGWDSDAKSDEVTEIAVNFAF